MSEIDRREPHGVVKKIEPLAPERERRGPDRRDCPRLPMKLRVRAIGGSGKLKSSHGDISVGGAYWTTQDPLPGTDLEVRFKLPSERKELSAIAQIVRIRKLEAGFGVHVRFVVVDVLTELSLARYIDARTRMVPLRELEDVSPAQAI
jgi:hypothetical protein